MLGLLPHRYRLTCYARSCLVVGCALIGAWMAACECLAQEATERASHALIVNAKNTTASSRENVKRLFLKQTSSWGSNLRAKPLDRGANESAHQVFLTSVLGMDESRFIAYWLERKQKTGVTRPLAISSDRALGKLVAKYPGAFGFLELEADQDPPEGTRVLFRF